MQVGGRGVATNEGSGSGMRKLRIQNDGTNQCWEPAPLFFAWLNRDVMQHDKMEHKSQKIKNEMTTLCGTQLKAHERPIFLKLLNMICFRFRLWIRNRNFSKVGTGTTINR